jgi:PAS domain S-box-containing protein
VEAQGQGHGLTAGGSRGVRRAGAPLPTSRRLVLRGVAVKVSGLALAAGAVSVAAALGWSPVAVGAVAGACGAVVLVSPLLQWRSDRHVRTVLADTAPARSLEALADPDLSGLPAGELRREVLARLRLVTGADVAALLLVEEGRGSEPLLRVAAVHGKPLLAVGEETAWGEGPIGEVGAGGEPVVVADLAPEERPGVAGSVASLMAAPVRAGGQVAGVVVVATARPHRFEPKHLRLVELAAWRIAQRLEHDRLAESERRNRLGAEHARLHLGMLAQAGLVLSRAMDDYEGALGDLAEVVVPAFADWFCVELVDEGGRLRRVCERSAHAGPAAGAQGDGEPGSHPHPEGALLVRQALDSGRPRVVMPGRSGSPHGGEPAAPEEAVENIPALGVESMLVVPIRVRGLSMGALTFVTEAGRRGYRRSDLETAEGLANRVGLAVERVLAWRQVQQAEAAATRQTVRLQALMEAALAVSAPLSEDEVLDVLVAHAHRLVEADHVVVSAAPGGGPVFEREWSAGPSGPTSAEVVKAVLDATSQAPRLPVLSGEAEAAAQTSGEAAAAAQAPWVAVTLAPAEGTRRVLVVLGPPGRPFGEEDESVLSLLAQMASEALENSRLYAAVRANQDRLQAIVDSSPLPIAELDLEGQARWWNRAASELFGWQEEGPVPKRIPVRDSAAGVLAGLWARSRRGDATVGTQLGAVSPAGEQLELSISTAPLRDVGGEVTGVLVVAEDVTERRRLMDRFHQADRLSAMARMASGMAHDFNNLLTVVLGCSEVLMARVQDEALLQEVTAIQRAGQRAAALTGQLLAIGQRRTAQAGTVVLDEVVCAMEPMLVGLLGEDVSLEIDPGATAVSIAADQGELERAVLNLAINARDAMPEGGTLAIRTHLGAAGRRDESRLVALTISDTGVGMDVETREHCFEPFFTTKGLARGTGLGLATVHAMVSQAGGQITVESTPGKGSSFTLWFPVAAPSVLEPTGVGQEDSMHGVVLFVEDEPELRRLSARELERRGYTVVAVAGAEEAVGELEAREGDVDLVVTDVVMPGKSGLELRRIVSERYPEVPVLLISGNISEGTGGEPEALDGEPAFLGKPFTPDQLVFRVRQLLMGRAARRQSQG